VVPAGASSNAVMVPASALRKGPAGDHVFVLTPDAEGKTRAHMRPVRGGPIVGDEVVILEGLKAGEQVAASGSFKLREGVLVVVADAAVAAAGEAK
jgi:membrane fusion protein (multidrug efflux system)